jgi:hypothetical protein
MNAVFRADHQAQAEEAFDLRMFRYFVLEHFKHGGAIYPIALFSATWPAAWNPTPTRWSFL